MRRCLAVLTLPSSGSLIEGRLAGRGWLGQRERRRDVAGWVRRLAVGTLALAVLVVAPVSAQASQSAEQELAEQYSPVLSLESQQRQCGPGEAYWPTSVGIVLGRPGVLSAIRVETSRGALPPQATCGATQRVATTSICRAILSTRVVAMRSSSGHGMTVGSRAPMRTSRLTRLTPAGWRSSTGCRLLRLGS